MELLQWIENNQLNCIFHKDNLIEINDIGKFLYIKPKTVQSEDNSIKENIIIFNNELQIDEDEDVLLSEVDYVLFQFGTKFYYSTKLESPEFNEFKYLGKSNTLIGNVDLPFVGLHSSYDLCNGSRDYDDWCKKAKFLEITTLGICEENTLAGTLAFQKSCKSNEIKSIIGESIDVKAENGDKYPVKIYCKNRDGWRNLMRIDSFINVHNVSEKCVNEEDLFKYSDNLICVLTSHYSLENILQKYKTHFKDNLYYSFDLTEWSAQSKDSDYLNNTKIYLEDYKDKIKPLLIYDAYYLDKEDSQTRKNLHKIGGVGFKNQSNNQYFKDIDSIFLEALELTDEDEKCENFIVDCISNTIEVFSNIEEFSILTGKFYLPVYEMTGEEEQLLINNNIEINNEALLRFYVTRGLQEKRLIGNKIYEDRIETEFEVIKEGGFIDYFLILADIFNFCKEKDIWTGLGRGSAAGSVISFLTNIVLIDPIKYNLLFERFLNRGRLGKSLPDIDSDIQGSRRDEVKRYIEQRYGVDYVASIGTYGTFKIRNLFKDLARIKGANPQQVNYMTAMIEPKYNLRDLIRFAGDKQILKDFLQKYPNLVEDFNYYFNQPKNQSIHPAGVIIVPKKEGEIYDQMPVKLLDGVLVSQWEGEYADKAGFLKCDILGIKQLDKFASVNKLIKESVDEDIRFDHIPLDDERTFALFKDGLNEDVFQLGAPGLKNYCRELKPDNIEDLIATVALYRPGPIENGTHRKYVKIKNKLEQIEYSEGCKEITRNTFGLIIYQEQVMQVCQRLADFSLVEADEIRKATGKKLLDVVQSYRDSFVKRAVGNGYSYDNMVELWNKMESFASYAFNRCISGGEFFYKASYNKKSRSSFEFSIKEMYEIKNNKEYAKITNHLALYKKYNSKYGYGYSFSLNEEKRLVKNKIKDIRYIGKRDIYRTTTESGKIIDTTLNHKFPTSNGEKKLEDIDITKDKLYVNSKREVGEKGLETRFETIKSIEFLKIDDVYDVEMEAPYHTFTTKNNIVTSNSHAACYAITGYYSQWYKVHYPLQFWTTSLTYSTDDERLRRISEIVKSSDIKVKSVDINLSTDNFTFDIKSNAIFWSLSSVKWVGDKIVEMMINERKLNGDYYSLEEFYTRVKKQSGVNKRSIKNLIIVGAFDIIENIRDIRDRFKLLQLFATLSNSPLSDEELKMEFFKEYEWTIKEKELTELGFVNFEKIYKDLEEGSISKKYQYNDIQDILSLDIEEVDRKNYVICGFLENIIVRNSKRGKFAQLEIKDNLDSLYITCWNETYEEYKDILDSLKGNIVCINGVLTFDNYKKSNVLHSAKDTKIIKV